MVSKKFKVEVFGYPKGFDAKPIHWDWSNEGQGTRKLDITFRRRKGITGGYYVYMTVTRDTEAEVHDEFVGQVTDGFFENDRIGKVCEVLPR